MASLHPPDRSVVPAALTRAIESSQTVRAAANEPVGDQPPRTPTRPLRVLVVDPSTLVREGLAAIVRNACANVVIGQAASWQSGLNLAASSGWDLVFVASGMADAGGRQSRQLRSRCPGAAFVGVRDDADDVGGAGAPCDADVTVRCTDDVAELRRVVQHVVRDRSGRPPRTAGPEPVRASRGHEPGGAADAGGRLTERQREVLQFLVIGMSNKAIARALQITEPTVKIHVGGIFRALNVTSRTQAIVAASSLQG